MSLQFDSRSTTVPQAPITRTRSFRSSNKENQPILKGEEKTQQDFKDLEKARAFARSVTRDRLKHLVVLAKSKETNFKKPRVFPRARRTDGKLSFVMNLPIELFCEVASRLSPSDLLQLARTSKGLRDILISKQSRPIWRAARVAQELPECPEDLSEVEYASLLFDKECQACGCRAKNVDILLRLRLCKACFHDNVILGQKFIENASLGRSVRDVLFDVLPYYTVHGDPDCREMPSRPRFFMGDLILVSKALHKLKNRPAERKVFIGERIRIVRLMVKTSIVSEAWLSVTDKIRQSEDHRLRNEREEAIIDSLLELGYDIDDIIRASDEHTDEWRKLVRQPSTLTNRNWSFIRPKLEFLVEDFKQQREQRRRLVNRKKAAYVCFHIYLSGELPASTYHSKSDTDVITKESFAPSESERVFWNELKDNPSMIRFLHTPAFITFKGFLKTPAVVSFIDGNYGSEVSFDTLRQLCLEIKPQILSDRYSADTRFAAASFIGHHSLIQSNKNSDLPLSPTLRDTIKRALAHGRLITLGPAALYSAADLSIAFLDCNSFLANWSNLVAHASPDNPHLQDLDASHVQCHPQTITTAYSLLLSLGFEKPELGNVSELYSLGEIFVCLKCHPAARARMAWPNLVKHFVEERAITFSGRKLVTEGVLCSTFKLDHNFAGTPVTFDQPTSSLYPTIKEKECSLDYATKMYCLLCAKADRKIRFMTELEAEVHAPIRHAAIFSPADFCFHEQT